MSTWRARCHAIGACCAFSAWTFVNILLNVFCCVGITICKCSPRLGFWRLCQRTRKPSDDQQYALPDNGAAQRAAQRSAEDGAALQAAVSSPPPYKDNSMQYPIKIQNHTVSWEPFPSDNQTLNGGPPVLWVGDKVNPNNVRQGHLPDCWFLASVAGLAERPGAIERCFSVGVPMPPGALAMVLYDKDGQPRYLPIDDRFPMSGGKLRFGTSSHPREMWVSALEKGIAKLRGGYDKLAGGVPSAALHALTGAATEQIQHSEVQHPDDLWKSLSEADADKDIIVAGTSDDVSPLAGFAVLCAPFARCCSPWDVAASLVCPRRARRCTGLCCRRHCWGCYACFSLLWGAIRAFFGSLLSFFFCPCIFCGVCASLARFATRGLVPGHAYSIVSVQTAPICCGCCHKRLVKLRNPWGKGEWSGPWSDTSCLWCCVSTKERDRMGYKKSDDGIFFMSITDYSAHFSNSSICHLRAGWSNLVVPTLVRGPCAYWTITVGGAGSAAPPPVTGAALFGGGAEMAGVPGGIQGAGAGAMPVPSAPPFHGEGSEGGADAGTSTSPFHAQMPPSTAAPPSSTVSGPVASAGNPFSAAATQGAPKDEVAVAVVNPLASAGVGVGAGAGVAPSTAVSIGAGMGGVRAFVTLLHSDGTAPSGTLEGSQSARLSVIHDATRKPVASSRASSGLSSYSHTAACGTSMLFLEAGCTYTVFAQWSKRDSLMMSPNGRPVTLLVTLADSSQVTAVVSPAPPFPRYPWAPSASLFGNCNRPECRAPLPAEFNFYEGLRYHPECTPSKKK
jgi:hypothetical protein